MLYKEISLTYPPCQPWERECLEAETLQALADIGFEAFVDDKAYIQSSLWDEQRLRSVLSRFGVVLSDMNDCPDEDWNAVWEESQTDTEIPLPNGKIVRIHPECAFGAGHHETTTMMTQSLLSRGEWIQGKTVLDNGCGTGILAITARLLGASDVVAVDIDDKCVTNTRENAVRNHLSVDETSFRVIQGAVPPEGRYDLILSNIHRNILLEQMPLYARYLNPNGEVWLSGFYEADCHQLEQAALSAGLIVIQRNQLGEWRQFVLSRLPMV